MMLGITRVPCTPSAMGEAFSQPWGQAPRAVTAASGAPGAGTEAPRKPDGQLGSGFLRVSGEREFVKEVIAS